MRQFTDEDTLRWTKMIGKRVWKNPKTTSKFEPKPFKSGLKINTVKGMVIHEQTGRMGFTFEEDESVVECFRCSLAPVYFPGDSYPLLTADEIQDRLDRFYKSGEKDYSCFDHTPESQMVHFMYPHRVTAVIQNVSAAEAEHARTDRNKKLLNDTYGKIGEMK